MSKTVLNCVKVVKKILNNSKEKNVANCFSSVKSVTNGNSTFICYILLVIDILTFYVWRGFN